MKRTWWHRLWACAFLAHVTAGAAVAGLALSASVPALAASGDREEDFGFAIGLRRASWVDTARKIKPNGDFPGADTRRLDVMIWYPVTSGAGRGAPAGDAVFEGAPPAAGRRPLLIYSHGTNGRPDNAMGIVRALVHHGYVVAAPAYPLSSLAAYTHIRMTDVSDVANQVKDIHFLIDQLLADGVTGPVIDPGAIGIYGHSLGGVTSYFAVYGRQLRDPRVKAVALLGGGDPVQTALANDMGLWGTGHAEVAVPSLILSADKDIFSRMTGRPFAAYERVEGPKTEVLIHGGAHVWFRDEEAWPSDNSNPDCLFFVRNMPGVKIPGCDDRTPLIGPGRQQAITVAALRDFFDSVLQGDAQAKTRLHALGGMDPAVTVRFEDQ
ncbi:alpha/beta hydrolase family protein [Novosphingobium album (ex Hu et al. 2023)]|uniref:Dienelactone hydrolase n=1 Tax=Novosphingobium album (ex Hu et al. 2023) TaxID=2930093 RepID=A0ABT0B785_9SPHN|nr:hypothetical protein [Novosphingobium album (ex Hu et al. 2023)]MCJ2180674.1 hypothetical protein [Novosphingobium album (ex Hu et al. 2023)]